MTTHAASLEETALLNKLIATFVHCDQIPDYIPRARQFRGMAVNVFEENYTLCKSHPDYHTSRQMDAVRAAYDKSMAPLYNSTDVNPQIKRFYDYFRAKFSTQIGNYRFARTGRRYSRNRRPPDLN